MTDRRDQDDDRDDDEEMEITDPDEFHKTQRLMQIHETRETFSAVYRNKEADPRDAGKRATAAVALDYVRQLEPLIQQSNSDLLEETVAVGGYTVTISELLEHGGTITTTELVPTGRRQTFPNEETTTHRMNKSTSLKLVRRCDRWLDRYMELDIQTDTADVAATDYSDIL